MNKEFDTQLLFSESVSCMLSNEFALREVAETRIRGLPGLVKVFTLDGSVAIQSGAAQSAS